MNDSEADRGETSSKKGGSVTQAYLNPAASAALTYSISSRSRRCSASAPYSLRICGGMQMLLKMPNSMGAPSVRPEGTSPSQKVQRVPLLSDNALLRAPS